MNCKKNRGRENEKQQGETALWWERRNDHPLSEHQRLNQMFSSLRMNDECDINALSIDINALSCCQ
eukprot:m.182113 g.182113  ORF g.182113 m.182113 type:complete len:66 (+) comp16639_c4_seq1:1532-1729(+)